MNTISYLKFAIIILITLITIFIFENKKETFQSMCTEEMNLNPVKLCKNQDICCNSNNKTGGNCFCKTSLINDCGKLKDRCIKEMCKYNNPKKCKEMCNKVLGNCCDYAGLMLNKDIASKYHEPIRKIGNTGLCKYALMPENEELCAKMCYHYPKCTGYSLKKMSRLTVSPSVCTLHNKNDLLTESTMSSDIYYKKK